MHINLPISFSTLSNVYQNRGSPDKEIILKVDINSQNQTYKRNLAIPPKYHGWISFSLDQEIKSNDKYKLYFPREECWINGIVLGKQKEKILWPWQFNVTVINHFRDPLTPDLKIDFSLNRLLEEYNAGDILGYVSKVKPIISDSSGLVFIKTIYSD